MALEQSAFNFDFVPEEKKPEEKVLPVKEPEKIPVKATIDTVEKVDEEIREIEFKVEENAVKLKAIKAASAKKSTRGRMKLAEMDAAADLIEIPEDEVLFEKNYYSIGTVSEMFKVNVSLIRFWENEFDILKPKKNGKGDRLFRPVDVKNLKLIYHLLRERKYTIEGAKEFLKKNKKAEENFALVEGLQKVKSFLNELKAGF